MPTTTLHERRDTRAKQAVDSRIEGGRPEHGWLLHLEGHVEELIAETDDARLFERFAHAQELALQGMERARELREASANFADSIEAGLIMDRVATVLHRIGAEMHERSKRLLNIVVPEIRRCYEAGEKFYAEVVKA